MQNAMTGFEEAFEQFATSGLKNTATTSELDTILADNNMDVSATQVKCSRSLPSRLLISDIKNKLTKHIMKLFY